MAHPSQTKQSRRGRVWVSVVTVIALAGLAGGAMMYSRDKQPSAKTGSLTSDRVAVRRGAFDITITAAGELNARKRTEFRSRLERQSIIVNLVDEGTRVKAGDLLVQLNADEIQTQIDEELLRVESALADKVAADNSYEIQVRENASRLREAELKVELANLALAQWLQGEVQIRRQVNDLAISRAELELERLAEKYRNSQELFAQGFVSRDECDRDELSYIEAISNYKTSAKARQVYEEYEFPQDEKKKNSDVAQAQDELERVRLTNDIQLASKRADKANKESQHTIRNIRLKKLRDQFEAATIRAPQDGLVVYATSLQSGGGGWRGGNDQPLQIGQQVSPNQPLIILPDTSEMVAAIRVQEAMAGRVRPGQSASIKVEAAGGRVFAGRVESISVLAEGGGWRDPNLKEYTVTVSLVTEPNDTLKPAMRAEATIVLGEVKDALIVPVQAVFQDGPVRYVYQEEAGKFVKTAIKLGRRSDTMAEITAGVNEGGIVLLREPTPGEVISRPWERAKLELAGYKYSETGEVIPEGGMPDVANMGGHLGAAGGSNGGAGPMGGANGAGQGGGDRRGQRGPGGGGRNRGGGAEGSSEGTPSEENGVRRGDSEAGRPRAGAGAGNARDGRQGGSNPPTNQAESSSESPGTKAPAAVQPTTAAPAGEKASGKADQSADGTKK